MSGSLANVSADNWLALFILLLLVVVVYLLFRPV